MPEPGAQKHSLFSVCDWLMGVNPRCIAMGMRIRRGSWAASLRLFHFLRDASFYAPCLYSLFLGLEDVQVEEELLVILSAGL